MMPFLQKLLLQVVGLSIVFTAVTQIIFFALPQTTATNILDKKIDELKLEAPVDFVGSSGMKSQYVRNEMRAVIRNGFKRVLMDSNHIDPFIDVLNQTRHVLIYDIPLENLNTGSITEEELNARIEAKYHLYRNASRDCIGVKLGIIRINNIQESDKILKTLRLSTQDAAGESTYCILHYSGDYHQFFDGDLEMHNELNAKIAQWTSKQDTLYTPELVKYKNNSYILYPEKCYDLRVKTDSSLEHIRGACMKDVSIELAQAKAVKLQEQLRNNQNTKIEPKLYAISIRDHNKYKIELLKSVFSTPKNEFCLILDKDKYMLIKVVDISTSDDKYKRELIVNSVADNILLQIAKE